VTVQTCRKCGSAYPLTQKSCPACGAANFKLFGIPIGSNPEKTGNSNPNLHPCEDCGKLISYKAKACPNCGSKQNKSKTQASALGCLVMLVLMALLVFFVVGSSDEAATTKPDQAPPTRQEIIPPSGVQELLLDGQRLQYQVVDQEIKQGKKLQLDLETSVAAGWLPDKAHLSAMVDDLLGKSGYRSGWPKVFITFKLPGKDGPQIALYQEDNGKAKLEMRRHNLLFHPLSVLLPPENTCPDRVPTQDLGNDPHAWRWAGSRALEEGCLERAITLLKKAIASGQLKVRKEKVKERIYNFFKDDKAKKQDTDKPKFQTVEKVVNHPGLARYDLGKALCQMAVQEKDRGYYMKAGAVLVEAADLFPEDSHQYDDIVKRVAGIQAVLKRDGK
jgi:RNA polymerase subunit RPABC4/transcription elongation factor Spt4